MELDRSIMPDITNFEKSQLKGALDWVGMSQVETIINHEEQGLKFNHLSAKANIYVNLSDPMAKGIHMSRIYLLAIQALENNTLKPSEIKLLLNLMVQSQEGRSSQSKLQINFELPIKRKALMSQTEGIRHYPVGGTWTLDNQGQITQKIEFEVVYSSTCPCSAALSRQLIKNKWLQDFSDQQNVSVNDVGQWLEKETSIVATPHAQRSRAYIQLNLKPEAPTEFLKYIDLLELALKTPVQASVKREDEQEFARLNGAHMMFCEDASRTIYSVLDQDNLLDGFQIRVEHLESLHSHNAVSEVSKNMKDL